MIFVLDNSIFTIFIIALSILNEKLKIKYKNNKWFEQINDNRFSY